MKKTLLFLSLFTLVFAACEEVTEEPIVEEPTEEKEIYTWEERGLSFEVPEGLMVSILSESLIIDVEDRTNFEGELIGAVSIRNYEETLESYIQRTKDGQENSGESPTLSPEEQAFKQELVSIGDKSFTKITFYAAFGDYMMTQYLIEQDGTLFVITEGLEDKQEATQTVLETLEFN
jgi:hypothetical protein